MPKLATMIGASALAFGALCGTAFASDGEGDGRACPVSWQRLRAALVAAKNDKSVTSPGAFKNNMWGVVVNRSGAVCAVAFSGDSATDQWLLSRQIASAKAFTANGLSLNTSLGGSGQLSTQQLYDLVQPKDGPLYGVHFGNIQDAADATKGPAFKWGTPNDPLVGKRVAGMITFGGGLALVQAGGTVVGGLGISGDTACQDDTFARAVRKTLNLNGGVADAAPVCK